MIAFDQTKPLLKDGKDIQYQGQTGIGPFNKNNDPSSANIGVYTFDKHNKPVFDHTQCSRFPCRGQHTKINIENQVKG